MATIKYNKLLELIRQNPSYIEYDHEIDPKAHLVVLFDQEIREKDITEIEIVEGHLIMDTKYSTMELSIGEDDLIKRIEFR